MKIELYLDGNQVEINQDIDFVLNKQFTELTDLTSIIVDYSKTIRVPMTPHNNELFNYVYKLDHQVLVNQGTVTYDPSQKISMVMNYNGSTVMEGYAILNSVDLKNHVYEVNLYGQLGKIFSDMKEKPLKDYKSSNNGFWAGIRMNTKTISDSFLNYYRNLDWASTHWYDFWGFAPQMIGKTDLIDTKNYENNTSVTANRFDDFEDNIDTTRAINYSDMYVGDGFDINQYCEIRTYLTRPYVYVDKIIQLVQNEINSGDYDGYTMSLDPDWFNSENPYYTNLCFFPGNESIVDSGDSTNGMVIWDNSERSFVFPQTFLPSTTSVDLEGYTYTTSNNLITISNSTSGAETTATLTLNCDGIVVRDRVTGVGNTSGFNNNGKWAFYNLANAYIIPIRYIGIYDSADQLVYKLYLCDDTIHSVQEDSGFLYYTHSVYSIGGVWSKLREISSKNLTPNNTVWVNGSSSNNYCEVTQQYNFGNVVLPTNSFRFKMGCDMVDFTYYTTRISSENISYSDYHTLCPFKNDKYKNKVWNNGATFSLHIMPIQSLTVASNTYRSGSYWTVLDVLGNDFNPFTWLVDYVKKFRLFFDIDYNTKTINLKSGYFDTVEYKNMIVDYSKPVIVEPIVDKYKRINYGYKANESKKSIKYYKNNGIQYGDMVIETQINLNNDTLSLTPNEDESVFIPTKLEALTYDNLNSTGQIKYSNPLFTNKIINTLNKDGEIEYYPFYAFRWANAGRPDQGQDPFYWLSDDTPTQKNQGNYCYLRRGRASLTAQSWDHVQETTDESGNPVYYLLGMNLIPQFDNFIRRTIHLSDSPFRGASAGTREVSEVDLTVPVIESDSNIDNQLDEMVTSTYDDPVTGETRVIRRSAGNIRAVEDEEPQTYLFWVTFGVPKEVYNGYLPSNLENYCIYNRWKNYLNEIFNVQNKKVTCYVRISYPEFINFKFNQLFVIDNCTFLVNKIIDFNPNSTEPTKVELIQISDADNLK